MPHRLIDFFKLLSSELNPETLLDKFLHMLMGIQNVERGSVWVKKDGFYACLRATGDQSEDVQGLMIPAGKASIVGWVIENGRRTIAEAGRDERHFAEAEKHFDTKSKLILAFPLVLSDGSVYGCVEVIDVSADGKRMNLDHEYLELLQSLVDVCSIALSNSVVFKGVIEERAELKRAVAAIKGRGLIQGPGEDFGRVLRLAESYSVTDYPVLITGESGTGKEVLAREIHRLSDRRDKPFLVQNCSAIPATLLASELFGYKKGAFTGALGDKRGLFEAAEGGAVFLDEIGDMGVELQASLLRALQDGEIKPLGATRTRRVNVRIISATNKDLEQAISQGEFRQDLYFRLNVLPLALPPLRERKEDIPYFLNRFIAREAERLNLPPRRISPAALALLMDYSWPGNVRELENLVKQLLTTARGEEIGAADLPAHIWRNAASAPPGGPDAPPEPGGPFARKTWEDVERDYVMHLLTQHRWVISRAAQAAGLKRSTFDSRLKKLGIRKGLRH